MRKAVWLVAVIFLLAVGPVSAAENIKIGFVDMAKALNESDAGKKAKADLEFMIKNKQSAIDEKGKLIEKAKSDLEKQASVLSADARKKKEEDLERQLREYQRFVADSQSEIKKKENDFTIGIIKELRAIIQKIGQDEGYTMLLENADGQILYAKKELDLTDIVIKKHNESKAKK